MNALNEVIAVKPTSVCDAVSRILSRAGNRGTTKSEAAALFMPLCPPWSPASIGPALSILEGLGCARSEGKRGSKRYFHVRDWNEEKDALTLRSRHKKRAPSEEAPRPAEQSAIAVPLIIIPLDGGRTETATVPQARRIWESLNAIFGGAR